jgi:hypothetical protein
VTRPLAQRAQRGQNAGAQRVEPQPSAAILPALQGTIATIRTTVHAVQRQSAGLHAAASQMLFPKLAK